MLYFGEIREEIGDMKILRVHGQVALHLEIEYSPWIVYHIYLTESFHSHLSFALDMVAKNRIKVKHIEPTERRGSIKFCYRVML